MAEAARADLLTDREHEVLRHMAAGLTNAEIAESLLVGEATVKSHVSAVFSKLGVRDRRRHRLRLRTRHRVPGLDAA